MIEQVSRKLAKLVDEVSALSNNYNAGKISSVELGRIVNALQQDLTGIRNAETCVYKDWKKINGEFKPDRNAPN
jgi:hypothetical protein